VGGKGGYPIGMTEKQEEQFRLLTGLKGVNASRQQIAWLLDDPQYDKEDRMLRQTLIDGRRMMEWLVERLGQATGLSGEDDRREANDEVAAGASQAGNGKIRRGSPPRGSGSDGEAAHLAGSPGGTS